MPIAIGNKRLPVTLDEKRQKELQQLKQKYGKSESKIMCIALDLLIAQEKAGFDIPALNCSYYLEYFLCPFYSILYQ
ncbi:TPA: hypothetical protein ACQDSE_002405 [Enterococcus faecium]|uniref:hypothetical protein n=1 Tax=Enterococcus faecium TaxID=1352 RepID=UPI000F81653C|nr:hypothetical protein [Enterococcus faecium]MCF8675154.1 hypothetical protein [Enterococcus faecium]HAQ4780555.1 hypothetical protein [Enterococcus faecium]HAQ4784194.1 hypothetical protein [Enterococcus faecium]HAQ4804469.1 hypothetical protein [Enterococcus faecium]HAQ5032615.1 hypothetical protein [Enterococcus faecium]